MSDPEKTYLINEIFLSLQGEGVRAGTANVFVRFARCNLLCTVEPGPRSPGGFDCDTEFISGQDMTAQQIVAEACRLFADASDGLAHAWVIFTGGEPMLQLDRALVVAFHHSFIKCALETNGTIPLGDLEPSWPREQSGRFVTTQLGKLDWVCVSPKVASHAVRVHRADELKVVRARGQSLPSFQVDADHYLVSPAFDGDALSRETLEWCMGLVKRNPLWRLSVQQHKGWRVR